MITNVKLDGLRDYPIFIDENINLCDKLIDLAHSDNYIIITNDKIAPLYTKFLDECKATLNNCLIFIVKDGESEKNIDTVMSMLTFMLENRLDRKTVAVAFGGGVIGDMVGFAASIFLRGIRFVQVPTTLLSMVDSSVGGKTGVNHVMGKNLIGAFYQPTFVWINTNFLKTLEEREYLAGVGEICKYGFIGGESSFKFINDKYGSLIEHNINTIKDAVKFSIDIKADIVSQDEREGGIRALLNFGHTFGHALERFYGYGVLLHGEAVLWGIKIAINAAILSEILTDGADELVRLSERFTYRELPSKPDVNKLYETMFSDKKVEGGSIRFVLPVKIGESIITKEISSETVLESLKRVLLS